ncbi:hypothetical protein BC01_231 [Bacillus phage BC01]|nr:hypothetical protein BC01_231 [Bacillus phage BC01]
MSIARSCSYIRLDISLALRLIGTRKYHPPSLDFFRLLLCAKNGFRSITSSFSKRSEVSFKYLGIRVADMSFGCCLITAFIPASSVPCTRAFPTFCIADFVAWSFLRNRGLLEFLDINLSS